MKILTGNQIKDADAYTIENEPVGSLELMERASEAMAQWICHNIDQSALLVFLVGKGNNGGDGLAMARILFHAGYNCEVYLTAEMKDLSYDCRFNLGRLPKNVSLSRIGNISVAPGDIIIDAILGSGIKGKVTGGLREIIGHVNTLSNKVISIDVPSGMPTENGKRSDIVIHADVTLTIQFPKLSMLQPESGEFAGEIVVIDIGLDREFMEAAESPYYYINADFVAERLLPRAKFGHKGTYGHALLICGSKGMAGAAVLAAGAALRSGCGLVTVHIPESERAVIHTTNPSAIVSIDSHDVFSELPGDIEKYNVIGVGPGMGNALQTKKAIEELLSAGRPMVIDADAINIIAENPELLRKIPEGSVLTPHIGELRRLIGEWGSDQEKRDKVIRLARQINSVLIVKGAHTMICTPDGKLLFNSSGNAGMAKGGSGDVLTGYLTGLISRGYNLVDAAVIAVYIHGKAGDKAAEYFGIEGMNSQDIIDFLGEAMAEISE